MRRPDLPTIAVFGFTDQIGLFFAAGKNLETLSDFRFPANDRIRGPELGQLGDVAAKLSSTGVLLLAAPACFEPFCCW